MIKKQLLRKLYYIRPRLDKIYWTFCKVKLRTWWLGNRSTSEAWIVPIVRNYWLRRLQL